jgi:formate dehydrogenase subunit delta
MNTATALHGDPSEKLIRMAGEIAEFFKSYPEDKAAASIANHINRYWTPKMRTQFVTAAATPGRTLPPLLLAASAKIKTSNVK